MPLLCRSLIVSSCGPREKEKNPNASRSPHADPGRNYVKQDKRQNQACGSGKTGGGFETCHLDSSSFSFIAFSTNGPILSPFSAQWFISFSRTGSLTRTVKGTVHGFSLDAITTSCVVLNGGDPCLKDNINKN